MAVIAQYVMSALIVACLALPSHISDVSVFLSHDEYNEFKTNGTDLSCSYWEFSASFSGPVNLTVTAERVQSMLQGAFKDHAPLLSNTVLAIRDQLRLSLQLLPTTLVSMSKKGTRTLGGAKSITLTSSLTIRDLLCLEILYISDKFNMFIPFLTESALALQKHHNIEFLEQHFGFPMVFPAADIINLFSDKALFGEWMVRQGLGGNIPSVYTSVAEVKYPVMVKFTHGRLGEGTSIANDQTELETATKSINSTDYILQVSQHAVACGSTVYTLGA